MPTPPPVCRYCLGKGHYSRWSAGGEFGDSFDGRIRIEGKIVYEPCPRCDGTGETLPVDIPGTFIPADQEINPFPKPAPEEKGKTLEEIIFMALGESSALFMSQGDTPAKKIVMPTEELTEIGNRTVAEITKHYARIEGEVRKDMNWALKTLKFCTGINQPLNRPQQEEVERLLAKYPDLIPSPTQSNG